MTAIICKCCGGATEPFGCADFSRTCEDRPTPVFAPTGEAVPYHRCVTCGFLFTRHFDKLTAEQMAEKIYNAQYLKADPGFTETRPRYFAGMLQDVLAPANGTVGALDFGGGDGRLAALMREAGFRDFASYDPFFGPTAVPAASPVATPAGTYDLITAFEVVEHARDPIGTFREMLGLLRPDGAFLFSTMLQPRGVDTSWWYMAPRNGHVSLHCRGSLLAIARLLCMRFLSIGDGLHLFYRRPGNQVTRSIIRRYARPTLRYASLTGMTCLLDASRQLAQMGAVRATLDPRHVARALLWAMTTERHTG